jgi:hypothetical protein
MVAVWVGVLMAVGVSVLVDLIISVAVSDDFSMALPDDGLEVTLGIVNAGILFCNTQLLNMIIINPVKKIFLLMFMTFPNKYYMRRPTAGGSGAWPVVQDLLQITWNTIEARLVISHGRRPSRLQPRVGRCIYYHVFVMAVAQRYPRSATAPGESSLCSQRRCHRAA